MHLYQATDTVVLEILIQLILFSRWHTEVKQPK